MVVFRVLGVVALSTIFYTNEMIIITAVWFSRILFYFISVSISVELLVVSPFRFGAYLCEFGSQQALLVSGLNLFVVTNILHLDVRVVVVVVVVVLCNRVFIANER